MPILLTLTIASLTSCATTTFYQDGKPVARFQGNMRNSIFVRDAKGATVWLVRENDHAIATLAGGKAFSEGATASGLAVATSGITELIK